MARMTLDGFVEKLREALGDGLSAVVLYGSAAGGEHVAKQSDYNVLVIMDGLGLEHLRAMAPAVRSWLKDGNPPPLTFTMDEWRRSADVFPMEYADILERHRVLHGEAPFDGISVDPAHLRLHLEHEAMGKLLQLRRGVLAVAGDERAKLELLDASVSTIMVIFRAALRLHGERPPADNVEVARQVAEIAGFDAAPFERVVRHHRAEQRLSRGDTTAVLDAYCRGMEELVAHLDRFN